MGARRNNLPFPAQEGPQMPPDMLARATEVAQNVGKSLRILNKLHYDADNKNSEHLSSSSALRAEPAGWPGSCVQTVAIVASGEKISPRSSFL